MPDAASSSSFTSIVVRGYELRRGGNVPIAVLARYFEHARWDAMRGVALGVQGFLVRGVVRAQWLGVDEGFGYGTTLEVETWLSRVGRTSLELAHRARRKDDAVVVARGACTLVALGAGGPAPLPDEARALPTRDALPRPTALDAWPEPFLPTSTQELRVGPGDEDVFGHVNQARYVELADDARWRAAHCAEIAGVLAQAPTVAASVSYLRELHAGDRARACVMASAGAAAVSFVGDGGEACRVVLCGE